MNTWLSCNVMLCAWTTTVDVGWHSSVDLFAWKGGDEEGAAANGLSLAAAAAAVTAFASEEASCHDGGGNDNTHVDATLSTPPLSTKDGGGGCGGGEGDVLDSHPLDAAANAEEEDARADEAPDVGVVIRNDLTRSWFNVWPPGSGHPAHDHADASIAGVFYAQVPKVRRRRGGGLVVRWRPARGTLVPRVERERASVCFALPSFLLSILIASMLCGERPPRLFVFPSVFTCSRTPSFLAYTTSARR